MKGMNLVVICGNLGRDPEGRDTKSGAKVVNMNVAVGERKKEGDEWVDHTEWVRVTCFGRTAENAEKFLSKGSPVLVRGRMSTREYVDKSDIKRWSTEVVAHEVTFLPRGEGRGSPSASKSAPVKGSDFHDGIDEDGLPF